MILEVYSTVSTIYRGPSVGDRYPLGPLEGERALREASGQLPRKAISSWAGQKLLAEWVGPRRQWTRA
jgi:hypothetical protein